VRAEGPAVPNQQRDKPHTEGLVWALREKVYGRRGGFKKYQNSLFVYKANEIKLRGTQFIYLTKCKAHLLIQNIYENTSLRIINTSREEIITKLEYLRFEVLTAVMLTIQVFWYVTPYH
jgi:hypothetical protein